jgi:hypothetical protein
MFCRTGCPGVKWNKIIVFFRQGWQIRQHYLGAQRFWQKSALSVPIFNV